MEVGGVGGGKTGRARGREKEDMGGGVDRGKGGRGGGGRGQEAVVTTRTGVGEQGQYKRTALMRASEKGMTNMVEKLLAAGAKAETTDEVKREEERVGGGRRRAVGVIGGRYDGLARHLWCTGLCVFVFVIL